MLPQENARIEKIERQAGTAEGGFTEDYDLPATSGSTPESDDAWIGSIGCYWIERRERVNAGQTSTVILTRSVIVDDDHLDHEFADGDVLTVRHDDELKTARVELVEKRRMPGQPPSVRLTLEDG